MSKSPKLQLSKETVRSLLVRSSIHAGGKHSAAMNCTHPQPVA